MLDSIGRRISYLRVSVTDRCDLRCLYCMAEDSTFLPRSDVLSLEEIERLCASFIRLGVRKLRLTGGEPLVRRNVMNLIQRLGSHLGEGGLDELTLTTNGTQLARHAEGLAAAGVRRINVSLDTLKPELFRTITRNGDLAQVLDGIAAAKAAGLSIKINAVALKGVNEDSVDDLVAWCGNQGFDLAFIETMPLGDVGTHRTDQYLPLSTLRRDLGQRWTLMDSAYRTGGPARYVTVAETGGQLGFITPMSHTFCGDCNRVRLTATGRLYLCLGHEDSIDLKPMLRGSEADQALEGAIRTAIWEKPLRHGFVIDEQTWRPALARQMNATGG